MDALAIAVAAAGLILASHEHVLTGATVSVSALVGLAVAVFRRPGRRPATILPFSFGSHFVVMAICLLGAVVLQAHAKVVSAALFGFWLYYYSCVALAERKVRYVAWAGVLGSSWRTAEMSERPVVYWSIVALCWTMSAIFLTGAFVNAALLGES